MLQLRGLGLACLLALALPDSASALTNWTRTVWSDGAVQSFEFASDDWELVDIDPETPELEDPIVIQNAIEVDSTIGFVFQFVIPNFFDPLPTKLVDVTIIGNNPDASPTLEARGLDIVGTDSPFPPSGPPFPVIFELESRSVTPNMPSSGQLLVTESWIGHPNPDFEIVKLFVPAGFDLESIEIVTESVPEPGTLALLGLGLLGLAVQGRRLRSAARGPGVER